MESLSDQNSVRPGTDQTALEPFHPTISKWFCERVGQPSPPQVEGWPEIRKGGHVLIAAPTGTGKTLAAFLHALDGLLREGSSLATGTQVLYISPLKALGNDVQKNLQKPLAEIRELDSSLPEIEVLVRSGDTPASARARMVRKPPHILVTTPESLYILLTSDGGRGILQKVKTVIVDEIHALIGSKRGSHLALSLERLESLCGPVQRIGLSATQKPLRAVGDFLVGVERSCNLVDIGHLREMDVQVEIPPSPLAAVCSHETWGEIYQRMGQLIQQHRTTLIFSGTRKLAEQVAARLTKLLGEKAVACHHSSLSKERRLDAEQRLKAGQLQALVATASLELGIDIGEVDLVIQLGAVRSIATLLQRVGRSGHAMGKMPKGRLFPLTQDELVEAAALMRAIGQGLLDQTPQPTAPLDILAQQMVAACAVEDRGEEELWRSFSRAWPYRELSQEQFEQVLQLHTQGRSALLHRDGVGRKLRGTRRARLTAVTSGGAIPDRADYQVVLEPEGTFIGSVDEDFAVESSAGDIFQLGNTSWRVLGLGRGILRVADAHGHPPSLPFWFGEAPARTRELSAEIGEVRQFGVEREWLQKHCHLQEEVAGELAEYLQDGCQALGGAPTPARVIAERFFDESGGMQLVLHAPFGGRINRAWGLALRKRFCRHFGFELQAAANEEAILISLGPHHSFPLEDVFQFLSPANVEAVLAQAVLPTPLFATRWRWNVCRSLLVERMKHGKRVGAPLIRMRADDLLVKAFPEAVACGENLPPGDLPIPRDHPMVEQTILDCLHEAMDAEGFEEVLQAVVGGEIETLAVQTPEPSPFAKGILSARPYSFLDDAPLEERRTQAVYGRRSLDPKTADELGELDPAAVERVRQEAWPDPRNAEEVHEALSWMGYLTDEEGIPWQPWLQTLLEAKRVQWEQGRWYAVESSRNPVDLLRGRMEALGPVLGDDPEFHALEQEGTVLRVRFQGQAGWCERRLLARILRYTLESLRAQIEPVSAAVLLRFLAGWQHLREEDQLQGPAGVAEVLQQLAGFEVAAPAWEKSLLPARVRDYRPEWLDQLCLSGRFQWGRLWGSGAAAPKSTPLSFWPREEEAMWLGLAAPPGELDTGWRGSSILKALQSQGALFGHDLGKACGPLSSDLEMGLQELMGYGVVTNDGFAPMRYLMMPSWKRKKYGSLEQVGGRWSLLRQASKQGEVADPEALGEFVAKALLRRYGVVFRALLGRERLPMPWRDLIRSFRRLELRGEIRGGRFVRGFAGEQFALPEAVVSLRKQRQEEEFSPLQISAADPLNLHGILTPESRIPPSPRRQVPLS
ncbi:MAG: hypothetical protein DWQ01_06760 [Planctomycetota bacterium]|nr:MAG: hypothetical protein DWQ01_06760 [Planctomycetota bacterium]